MNKIKRTSGIGKAQTYQNVNNVTNYDMSRKTSARESKKKNEGKTRINTTRKMWSKKRVATKIKGWKNNLGTMS